MFYGCISLEYLDISNFDTKLINNMENAFFNTSSLLSLNLSNFDIHDSTNVANILLYSNPNLILCYNESKMPPNFFEQANGYINSCKELCIMNSKKFIPDNEICVDNCFNEAVYKYEYQNICYTECPIRTQLKNDSTYLSNYYNYERTGCIDEIPEGYYLNSSTDKTIDKCPSKCKTCSSESIIHNLCEECNTVNNFYPKFNDSSNVDSFHQCYNSSEEQTGYYLDNSEKKYKPCYYKCKKCIGEGDDENNNCQECNDEYIYDNGNCKCPNYYNYERTGCIDEIPEGYYLNSSTEKTIDKCPSKCKSCSLESININLCISCKTNNSFYPKLNDPLNLNSFYECYNKEEEQIGYYFDNEENIFKQCYYKCKKCESKGNDENNNCSECIDSYNYDNGNCNIIDDLLKKENQSEIEIIKENLINKFNKTEILNGNDEEITLENIIITLTTTDNQKNNLNINKTTIDIGDCEYKLKDAYNISYNDSLYIIKIDVNEEGMKIPKVEYEVYYPLYNDENIKLNLSYCKDSKIDISIPVKINDDIEKYNSSSDYYNDECSKATSDSGTDISLTDRRNIFKENNMSLCEENCDLVEYNYTIEKAKCRVQLK